MNATPCPNWLGRLECEVGAEGEVTEGAGDCGRGDDAVEVFAGGPFAQADFDGSCDDVFGTEAVDDLLILSLSDEEKRGLRGGERLTKCSDGFD